MAPAHPHATGVAVYPALFYKNLVYKNIKALNGSKIKNILRTYERFIFWEKKFRFR